MAAAESIDLEEKLEYVIFSQVQKFNGPADFQENGFLNLFFRFSSV